MHLTSLAPIRISETARSFRILGTSGLYRPRLVTVEMKKGDAESAAPPSKSPSWRVFASEFKYLRAFEIGYVAPHAHRRPASRLA
jgi:hypothetical protein